MFSAMNQGYSGHEKSRLLHPSAADCSEYSLQIQFFSDTTGIPPGSASGTVARVAGSAGADAGIARSPGAFFFP
jgi:hypothetical protein